MSEGQYLYDQWQVSRAGLRDAAQRPRPAEFTSASALRTFLYAGDAVLTLQSGKTGKHFTYGVRKSADERSNGFYLTVLADGDKWVYVGMIYPENRVWGQRVRMTPKSRMDPTSPCVRAFDYMLAGLRRDEIAKDLAVWHEGRCGKCRRPLTRPDSITRGLGPDCAAAMGLVCEGEG